MSQSSDQSGVNDFVVRIAYIDYYMAPRVVDHDRQVGLGGAKASVPVVRVFGPTHSGQTACLHLHGVRTCRALRVYGP